MRGRRRNWIFYLRALSACLTVGALIWWVLADREEPRWLFYPSLIVTVIVSLVDRRTRHQFERPASDYEDLGPTPATYGQAARDKEQKRFRLGAYRTTIRVSVSEEAFLRQLQHRAQRLGFRSPEIQIEDDCHRILLQQAHFFENAANRINRAQTNMEFDLTRLNDTGEVDVCAWVSALTWIPSVLLSAVGCAFETLCLMDKAPLPIHLCLLLFIGLAVALVPMNIRFVAKRTLRELHREWITFSVEDQP